MVSSEKQEPECVYREGQKTGKVTETNHRRRVRIQVRVKLSLVQHCINVCEVGAMLTPAVSFLENVNT